MTQKLIAYAYAYLDQVMPCQKLFKEAHNKVGTWGGKITVLKVSYDLVELTEEGKKSRAIFEAGAENLMVELPGLAREAATDDGGYLEFYCEPKDYFPKIQHQSCPFRSARSSGSCPRWKALI